MGDPLRFEALGPLRAWRGEAELGLGPLQQRAVLAVLLLHANRPLGREQFIDAVWGPAAPAYAVNLLQKHVAGVRRVLDPGRAGRTRSAVLAWTDAGYVLTVEPGQLDVAVFDRQVIRARAARAAGDPATAAELLHAALRLWRGPACDGLPGPFLDAERARLAERRITVLADRIDLDLTLGNHPDLVAEVRQLVAEHPLHERLRALLMLALHRSGQQAEALVAFHDARRLLRDELGIEPGTALQRLHRQILTADPALDGPSPGAAEPVAVAGAAAIPAPIPAPAPPAQLPYGLPDFTGRGAELARLDAVLADHPDGARPVVAITGTAGVGKTALAVHWAHQIRDRFPDGQLHVDLRGFGPAGSAMEPGEAVRHFLDAFGVPPQRVPVQLPAQAALYRSLLADRRVLIVLDNARDADQVRPLLPGSPGCLTVVTSRNQLAGLVVAEGAHPLGLDLLPPAEARGLLAGRIGAAAVAAEPAAVDDIIGRCARLPLALAVVAARAAAHPGFPLAVLAGELSDAQGGLDAFDAGDAVTDVRAVFSWSYQRLGPPAARLFRLLGLHAGPDIDAAAAASLAGVPPAAARRALAELSRLHLVTERAPGRFACHDLLRAYAAELAEAVDPDADRRAAAERALDHYLHSARAAGRLVQPHWQPVAVRPPAAGVTPVEPGERDRAVAWLAAERPVLLAHVQQAARAGFDTHAWQLAWTLTTFLHRNGHFHDASHAQHAAVEVTARVGNRRGEGYARRGAGLACIRLHRYDDARTHFERALQLFDDVGDRVEQGHTHRNLAWVLDRQSDHQAALAHSRRSLELFRAAGDRVGEADALNAIGWFQAQLGEHGRALEYCGQALALLQELGHRDGEAHAWDSLGYAYRRLGRHGRAVACYRRSIEVWHEVGDRQYAADTLVHLGDTHLDCGEPEAARDAWRRALAILDEFDRPESVEVQARLDRLDREPPPAPTVGSTTRVDHPLTGPGRPATVVDTARRGAEPAPPLRVTYAAPAADPLGSTP